jgi:signal transduction histidine kinase
MENEKVLIVEDDAAIRSLCGRLLESEGFQVITTGNGEEGLRKLADDDFDLLLTDIRLPGMTGLEIVRRARERGLDLPVVVMTGYSSLETAIQALSLGVDEFIIKPFAMDALRRTISHALEKTRLRHENARLRALMPLFENSRDFVTATTREQLRARVVEAVAKTIPAEAVTLLECDAESQVLTLVAACGGEFAGRIGETIALDAPAARLLTEMDQVQVWRGAQAAPAPLALGAGADAIVIGASLTSRGHALGFLVGRALPGTAFTVSDAEALTIVAGQAAAALEKARLIEELQSANRDLEELDQLKSEFINVAAHELRTPLSVLLSHTLTLSEQLQGAEREQLEYILTNAERLRHSVENMFSLRLLDAGQAELDLESFDVGEALYAVVEAYRGLASQREQEVTVELPDELGPVIADRALFELMVGNLLSNAIKFSPRGGPVGVRAWGDANQVTFVVRDQGRGLTAVAQKKIFERFHQAGDALTREEGRLGLGLAITRGVVRAHRGKIWVESEPGKGSAFYISLPRHSPLVG